MDDLFDFLTRHEPIIEPRTFADGYLLGDWRITAYLGKGGSGEVYHVENVTSGKIAATKVLVRQDEAARERFRREVEIVASAESPSLVRYYTSGEADGYPYLITELLDRRPLPHADGEVARYVIAVCAGVAELHRHGFVHRDIKPANVLFRKDGSPVLIDFGLAKRIEQSPAPTQDSVSIVDGRAVGVGTPRYAAPEQFNGGEVSPATDIHALGMLANECFGGRPPRIWRTIIRRSTSSIPAQRYADVAAFSRAVRRRNWLRNVICMISGLIALAGMVAVAVWALKPEISRRIALNGQVRVVAEPVVLKGGRTYEIVGPGTFDADISGPTNAILRLKNCVLLNRTKRHYPENGIRYVLEDGVYLNFINMPQEPSGVRRCDYIAPYDGAYNEVRFGGPGTISGLRHLKNAEWYESLRDERK